MYWRATPLSRPSLVFCAGKENLRFRALLCFALLASERKKKIRTFIRKSTTRFKKKIDSLIQSFPPGLPDFSWYIPKREKYTTKCTKWQLYAPNGCQIPVLNAHKFYQNFPLQPSKICTSKFGFFV
jgi:hypothetical protein